MVRCASWTMSCVKWCMTSELLEQKTYTKWQSHTPGLVTMTPDHVHCTHTIMLIGRNLPPSTWTKVPQQLQLLTYTLSNYYKHTHTPAPTHTHGTYRLHHGIGLEAGQKIAGRMEVATLLPRTAPSEEVATHGDSRVQIPPDMRFCNGCKEVNMTAPLLSGPPATN